MISITPAVKSLSIRNLGIIRKADMEFTQGINMVYGCGGSGKTTILNAIRHILNGEKLIYGPSHNRKSSEKSTIEVELLGKKINTEVKKQYSTYEECLHKGIFPNGSKIPASMRLIKDLEKFKNILSAGERAIFEISETVKTANKGQAILMDDVLGKIDEKDKKIILKLLKKSKLQIIITIRREHELIKGANVIRLRRPNE